MWSVGVTLDGRVGWFSRLEVQAYSADFAEVFNGFWRTIHAIISLELVRST